MGVCWLSHPAQRRADSPSDTALRDGWMLAGRPADAVTAAPGAGFLLAKLCPSAARGSPRAAAPGRTSNRQRRGQEVSWATSGAPGTADQGALPVPRHAPASPQSRACRLPCAPCASPPPTRSSASMGHPDGQAVPAARPVHGIFPGPGGWQCQGMGMCPLRRGDWGDLTCLVPLTTAALSLARGNCPPTSSAIQEPKISLTVHLF